MAAKQVKLIDLFQGVTKALSSRKDAPQPARYL
jgi:hypothetical protein